MDRRLQENVVGVERRVFVSVTADSNPAGFAAQIEQIPTRAARLCTTGQWTLGSDTLTASHTTRRDCVHYAVVEYQTVIDSGHPEFAPTAPSSIGAQAMSRGYVIS
jgi:hypothetical protein